MDLKADTKTISIAASPARVFRFVADGTNLPRWAIGFASAIRREGDGWVVTTRSGTEVPVRIRSDERTGVVDFIVTPEPGVEALAASRVIPHGDVAEYAFTHFQAPGMADEAFAKSVAAVGHELTVLRALLETECPV